jgi:hypothetical protein
VRVAIRKMKIVSERKGFVVAACAERLFSWNNNALVDVNILAIGERCDKDKSFFAEELI